MVGQRPDRERDNRRDCAPAKLCRHCDSNDFFQRQFDGPPQYKTPNLALLVEAPEVPAFRHYHLDNLCTSFCLSERFFNDDNDASVDSDGGILSEPIETLDVAAKLLREIAEISDTLGVLKGISGVILRITTAIVTIEQNSEEWKELGNVLQAQEKLLKDQLTRLEWDDTEYHKTCPLRAPFQETLERLLEEIIERLELQGNHAVTVYQHLKTFIWRMASVEREKADIATISQRLTQNMENLQVITIDSAAERYALQPDNAIVLPKWKPGTKGRGEHGEGDLGLVGLIPFVESVVIYNTAGVRPIFKAYHGRDITAGCAKVEVLNKKKVP
ncbi:mitochondrial inner membrane protein required for protein import [Serendipita sp. 397]|nr:mitochondrial inner membrane protein required for protein import [Serendipita sp. 397]